MQPISLKSSLAGLTIVGVAALTSGLLAACSTPNQSETSNTTAATATNTSFKQNTAQSSGMHHHTSMDLGPADADYDLRFIDAMIPHHQGAVNMAKEVLNKSQRPEMKKLAQDIIAAQNREINQMKQWRESWYPKAPSTPMAYHAQMGHMMPMTPEQIQSMMMSMDLGAANAEFDLRFINAMIPHHQGALVMAQDALRKTKRTEMKQLSQNILTSQQQEIDLMNSWKKAWYKQ
jgi:uncharacterized protein (DUF305 family)